MDFHFFDLGGHLFVHICHSCGVLIDLLLQSLLKVLLLLAYLLLFSTKLALLFLQLLELPLDLDQVSLSLTMEHAHEFGKA